ncbi:MAG: gamma-glutamylcyclotransferase [Planctomycetes bacterium]|nr:gamma-glutamylcyclotransferase [Planctomycetota bacterium]
MSSDLVFVYGTLKRGQRNHHFLAAAEYLGTAFTEPKYRIIDCGPYPALLEHPPEEPLAIAGEVYRVDGATLAELDQLEDEGRLYRRAVIEVLMIDGGACSQDPQTLQVWTYFWSGAPAAFPLVPGSTWREAVLSPPTPRGRAANADDE